ncbi:MAG TPA: lipopolysaccharide kinase InaA family protein [Gemmatimonadaceae bacterium]|nr:lipopolysaccharide kinase InaA family protein [Gemmatimonadaceae bacterium]
MQATDTISPFTGSPIATRGGLIPDGMYPSGYVQKLLREARVVAHGSTMPFFEEMLRRHATLHEWAAQQPERRGMQGRTTAWAVPLPDSDVRVVVRHSQHGGMLAKMTRDVFRAPRAPDELRISWTLRHVGIQTPRVLGYALYPAAGGALFRADVVTREIADSIDLQHAMAQEVRLYPHEACIEATLVLLRRLARTWAYHPDLNCRNVLLSRTPQREIIAHVLDVDTLRFAEKRAEVKNAQRLLRSAQKLLRAQASAGMKLLIARLTTGGGERAAG